MSSKNIQEEYFTNNNNIKDKTQKEKNERNNRFSLLKPCFLNKSKITSILPSFNKENTNKIKKEKTHSNTNSIEASIRKEKRKEKTLNKILSYKKSSPFEKTSKSHINKNKSSIINNHQNKKKDYYLKSLNYTMQNHISLNSTSKSFFKDASKKKSLNKEKNNKEQNITEYTNKKKFTNNKDIKSSNNKFKSNIIKNKAVVTKKKYIFNQKEHPFNQKNKSNIINVNDNKLDNNQINSARLTERYKNIVLNKKNIAERTIITQNRSKDDKHKVINKKKFTFNDLKNINELVEKKSKKEMNENINHKKIDLSILLKNIITDNTNSSRNINSSQNNFKSKESENSVSTHNKINKTQDNINNIKISPKSINKNERKNNSAKKRTIKNTKEIISKILQNSKEKNTDYNSSFLKSARNFINSKRESFNYIKDKKKLNRYCNLLIYNNNAEKRDLYSQSKNHKSFTDRSKLIQYINFKIINDKKGSKDNSINKKNKSYKTENMSRNNKNSNNFTNTNSITIENNNTNYISPKQYEKEENNTNNNTTTPLIYNKMISMTMNNSSKMTVNNSNKKKNKKNNSIDKKLYTNKPKNNIINKKIHKKKIIHDKKLSIPNISKKNNILSEKLKNFDKISTKLSLTPITKDNSFIQKINIKKNRKIPIIKKIIKIDSCSVPGYSSPGVPKINQDNYFIIKEFLNNSEQFFMGLCDGHGSYGHLISKYICNTLPKKVTKITEETISKAILSTNKSLIEESKIDCSLSGSTCTTLIVSPDKIISASAGDTRAVLARYENGQYNAINLTRDHRPTESDEMKRILNSNGRIKQYTDKKTGKSTGPERIWLNNSEIPGLAISRSLGDNLAHSVGVISEPEIKKIEFNGNEKFILLASGGIWKFIDSDESVKIIKDFYEKNMDAVGALNKLVKQAFKRWKNEEDNMDDITVVLTFFE